MKPPDGSVHVCCDDPSHKRPVTIAYFYPLRDVPGCWQPWLSSSSRETPELVETLVDDALPDPGAGLDAFQGSGVVRRRWVLPQCRKCYRTPNAMREEKLFTALTSLADIGIDTVSLRLLAATIERIPT